MPVRLVIADLPRERLPFAVNEDDALVLAGGEIRPCAGCFGCWIRTPGACVIRDGFEDMGARLARCDRIEIVSRLCYGGFSPFIKNVLDRSISYLLPNFRIAGGEMHHKMRYPHRLQLRARFYGVGIAEGEKAVARALVAANARNFGCAVYDVRFAEEQA